MTRDRDLSAAWLATLQEVADRAAHEIRDSLNGVGLNLEVVRSRAGRVPAGGEGRGAGGWGEGLTQFAEAAAGQLEALTARTEALLFLARPPRPGAEVDVAVTLKQLAALLVPAARADGGTLEVNGWERACRTSAAALPVRLALGAGLLDLVRAGGSGRCRLESGAGAVVRFSHESAAACNLDAATAALVAEHDIHVERPDGGGDLLLIFPGA